MAGPEDSERCAERMDGLQNEQQFGVKQSRLIQR